MSAQHERAPVISLSGKSGAGKDTVAQILMRRFDYERVAFADPIKRYVGELFGLTDEQLWGDGRNRPDERLEMAPREVYQNFGSFCREIDPDVWIRRWRQSVGERLEAGAGVICTDVRTPDELAAVRDLGGTALLITRPDAGAPGDLGEHPTEQMLTGDESRFDDVIRNDGTLEELEQAVAERFQH